MIAKAKRHLPTCTTIWLRSIVLSSLAMLKHPEAMRNYQKTIEPGALFAKLVKGFGAGGVCPSVFNEQTDTP